MTGIGNFFSEMKQAKTKAFPGQSLIMLSFNFFLGSNLIS